MKSFLHMYTALYAGLVKDLTATYPPLAHEFERDFNRLLQSIETEGLGFITLTHGEIEASAAMDASLKRMFVPNIFGVYTLLYFTLMERFLTKLIQPQFSLSANGYQWRRKLYCLARRSEMLKPCVNGRRLRTFFRIIGPVLGTVLFLALLHTLDTLCGDPVMEAQNRNVCQALRTLIALNQNSGPTPGY